MSENNLNFDFFNAKNGEQTCRLNGKYFHSAYAPSKEAQTFCNSIKCTFKPSCVIILEPALSFCAAFLRKIFPSVELIAIRFTDVFCKTDSLWDKVFYFFQTENFAQKLYSALGEEKILSALILDWPGSKNIFPEISNSVWKEIKTAVLTARDVLYTREKFAKRWFLNSLAFCKFGQDFYSLYRIKKDILITASGPSLSSSLKNIKKYRENFFLIAVSSSLSVLIYNKIFPDLVISTDGGFWAKKHLELNGEDLKKLKSTVFALTDEANCPKYILQNQKILPLAYPSSIGEKIFTDSKIEFLPALRNGTVSGTAAAFALRLTQKNVYFCGLDLAENSGFQHAQPNMLEKNSQNKDFRLETKEKRQFSSRFNSKGSLGIYRSWFKNQGKNFRERLFRLSDHYNFSEKLGQIKDLSWEELVFDKKNADFDSTTEVFFKTKNSTEKKEFESRFLKILESGDFDGELFPLESILLAREFDEEKKNGQKLKIQQKKAELAEKIRRLFDE